MRLFQFTTRTAGGAARLRAFVAMETWHDAYERLCVDDPCWRSPYARIASTRGVRYDGPSFLRFQVA